MTVVTTTGAASHEPRSASAASAYREGDSAMRNRVPHGAFERLERYDGKLSRTVLRGLRRSNAPWLPDWIRSVREECLDKLLIINQAHLRRVMREYIAFFNTARPHQGLDQQIPVPMIGHEHTGPVRSRAVLGGIIHDYYRGAA